MEVDALSKLPTAPQWSVWVGDCGAAAVVIAAVAFTLASLLGFAGNRKPKLGSFALGFFGLGCVSLFSVLGLLATLFLNDRFEWSYVRGHSDVATSAGLKFAAVWSGQEGSFLLWACCTALFVLFSLRVAGPYRSNYVGVSSLFLAAIAGILVFESPFVLSTIHGRPLVPPDGAGLAPSLLNYWVIIHPPTIFLGFGSLIVPFGLAMAALIQKDPSDWVQRARSMSLISLSLLGLGLCMGGFWAYETLGWGGFWAWDPVENTSFVPWCLMTAFIHAMLVQTVKKRWVNTTLLLGGLPFLSFMYGTFLTRSGLLGDTSVHSFAEMDRSALRILAGLGIICILSFVGLLAYRWKGFKSAYEPSVESTPREGLRRESMYAFGNSLLVIFALATGFGMSVPLVMSLTGKKPRMVEESLYHQVLPWFFLPILLFMALAPFVSWNGTKAKVAFGKLYGPLCVTIFIVGCMSLVMSWTTWAGEIRNEGTVSMLFGAFSIPRIPWTMFLAACCIFVVVANAWRLAAMIRTSKLGASGFLAHMGVGVLMAGLILSRGLEQRKEVLVQDFGQSTALGYLLSPKGTGDILDRNNRVQIDVQRLNEDPVRFTPGFYWRRSGDGELNPMAWPYVHREPLHDVYLALHGMEFNATEATPMKQGETKQFDRFKITFDKMTREGNPGQPGTKFGAKLKIVDQNEPTDTTDDTTFDAEPRWVLGEQGIEQEPAVLGEDFFMTIQSMDADSQSVSLQLHFRQALYAVELFVKPFTPLVWLGTGTLTLALLMSAIYRRPRGPAKRNTPESEAVSPEDPIAKDYATASTAQS